MSVVDDYLATRRRPKPPPLPEPDPDERTLAMLEAIRDAIAQMKLSEPPAPAVVEGRGDATELILEAISLLPTGASADDIGEAVAARLKFPSPEPADLSVLANVAEVLDRLDFRLRGVGGGGGGSVTLPDNPSRLLGQVSLRQTALSGDGETVSASGNNTVHTPASGKKVRLRYIYLQATTGAVTATVKLGSSTVYVVSLSPTGVPVFSHSTYREGGTNDALVVSLSSAETVLVNFDLEEVS